MIKKARPRLADFLERKGKVFLVKHSDSLNDSEWTLEAVEILKSPQLEGLSELECFSLVFSHKETCVMPQGIYHLDDTAGFRCELFSTPCSAYQMAATIN